MKKLAKILLSLIAVIALALGAIFYFTADMVSIADDFFVAVKENRINDAYSYLSDDFRADTSESELASFMEKNQLSQYQDANWQTRSINGGRGDLIGSITTTSGGVVPISMTFVKGSGTWKIYAIQKPTSGLQEESDDLQLPSDSEQVALVREATHLFAVSVNEKSMDRFRRHSSNLWQRQHSVEHLDEVFGPFYEHGVDLTILDDYSPRFDSKPSIDDNGILTIAGHYQVGEEQFQFDQKYIFEGLGWKLLGFSANIE